MWLSSVAGLGLTCTNARQIILDSLLFCIELLQPNTSVDWTVGVFSSQPPYYGWAIFDKTTYQKRLKSSSR